MEEQKIKIFIDHVGHTIVSTFFETNENSLVVKNPAILIASPNNTGQLTVQLVPVFFKEFIKLSSRDKGSIMRYPIQRIVELDIELEDRLLEQYVNMFNTQPKEEASEKEAPTIKLFDE